MSPQRVALLIKTREHARHTGFGDNVVVGSSMGIEGIYAGEYDGGIEVIDMNSSSPPRHIIYYRFFPDDKGNFSSNPERYLHLATNPQDPRHSHFMKVLEVTKK